MTRFRSHARIPAVLASAALCLGSVARAAAPAAQCPASFADFSKAFLDGGAARPGLVNSRVLTTQVMDARPEPRTVSKAVSASEALAMIPDSQARRRLGMTEVKLTETPLPRITLRKPDTDLQITLTFERAACWKLTRIDDESL